MNDINIITFHRAYNHGAVLQAYALQKFIENMGYSVGIFDYDPKGKKTIKGFILEYSKLLNIKEYRKKKKRFDSFVNNYLNLTIDSDCKLFLTGSDQVWNPTGEMNPVYFLRFLDKNIIKASFAASMGVSEIPQEKREKFKEYISDFSGISVREKQVARSVKELSDKVIELHVDPSLLLTSLEWEQVMAPVEGMPSKYILVYALKALEGINKLIDWSKSNICSGEKVPIVLIDEQGIIGFQVHHDIVLRNIGPAEFIWLIKNAEAVISTSFHGSVFSLIFHKKLFPLINPKAPSRIQQLLDSFGLMPIDLNSQDYTRDIEVNWDAVDSIREKEKKRSENYIKKLYDMSCNEIYEKTIYKIHSKCYGCGSCENSCPQEAISMVLNSEGFYYPEICEGKCVLCGKCLQKCPVNVSQRYQKERMNAYAAWNKSRGISWRSSSGGVFPALGEYILNQDGVVYGTAFDKEYRHVYTDSSDHINIDRFQKSKYLMGSTKKTYSDVKKNLEKDRLVLYTGTPCQIAGLLSYLGDERDNLITMDFICGGVPSVKLYNDHLDWLTIKYGDRIEEVEFRPKEKGWSEHYLLKVAFKNKKIYMPKYSFQDSFSCCFGKSHFSIGKACYTCKYAEKHCADITVGDFWGYKNAGLQYRKDGISVAIVNSQKGERLIKSVKCLHVKPVSQKTVDYAFMKRVVNDDVIKKRMTLFSKTQIEGFEKASRSVVDIGYLKAIYSKIKKFFSK